MLASDGLTGHLSCESLPGSSTYTQPTRLMGSWVVSPAADILAVHLSLRHDALHQQHESCGYARGVIITR